MTKEAIMLQHFYDKIKLNLKITDNNELIEKWASNSLQHQSLNLQFNELSSFLV